MTWSPTKSDRFRSGVRQVCGLVIDLSLQSRHVLILSVGLVVSQKSLWVHVVEFGKDTTRSDKRYISRIYCQVR